MYLKYHLLLQMFVFTTRIDTLLRIYMPSLFSSASRRGTGIYWKKSQNFLCLLPLPHCQAWFDAASQNIIETEREREIESSLYREWNRHCLEKCSSHTYALAVCIVLNNEELMLSSCHVCVGGKHPLAPNGFWMKKYVYLKLLSGNVTFLGFIKCIILPIFI